MSQQYPKWEDKVWSIPISNQMIASMLDEMLAHGGLEEDFQVQLVTHVTVDPATGLVTFFFTHSNRTNRVLQLVPDQPSKPRRIPVKEVTKRGS